MNGMDNGIDGNEMRIPPLYSIYAEEDNGRGFISLQQSSSYHGLQL